MYPVPRNKRRNAHVLDYLVDGFEHEAARLNDASYVHPEADTTRHHYDWGCHTQGTPGDNNCPNSTFDEYTQTIQSAVPADISNGIAPSSFFWPPEKRRLRVRFLNGGSFERDTVTNLIETHYNTIPMRIRFKFLKPGDFGPSDIRIIFGNESRSALGREAEKEPNEPTMWLNMYRHVPIGSQERRRRRQADILHEFGHSLGMVHEHQHPDCPAVWNYGVIQAKTGWNCAQIYKNYDRSFVRDTKLFPYDPESIMHYPVAPGDTRDGMMYVPHACVLSEGDRRFLMALYPEPQILMPYEVRPVWVQDWGLEYQPAKKSSGRHKQKKSRKHNDPGMMKWMVYAAGGAVDCR